MIRVVHVEFKHVSWGHLVFDLDTCERIRHLYLTRQFAHIHILTKSHPSKELPTLRFLACLQSAYISTQQLFLSRVHHDVAWATSPSNTDTLGGCRAMKNISDHWTFMISEKVHMLAIFANIVMILDVAWVHSPLHCCERAHVGVGWPYTTSERKVDGIIFLFLHFLCTWRSDEHSGHHDYYMNRSVFLSHLCFCAMSNRGIGVDISCLHLLFLELWSHSAPRSEKRRGYGASLGAHRCFTRVQWDPSSPWTSASCWTPTASTRQATFPLVQLEGSKVTVCDQTLSL